MSVRASVRLSQPFDPLNGFRFSRNVQGRCVLDKVASSTRSRNFRVKVKVTGVRKQAILGHFCAFVRTPPTVMHGFGYYRTGMCRRVIQKNVRSRNFEFLPESIFIEGQRSKMDTFDGNVKKTFFFYASNVMRGLSKVEQILSILNLASVFKNIEK